MIKRFLAFILLLNSAASIGQNLTQSELPIVVINTSQSQEIPDEPKILATMGIIDGGEGVINQITDPFTEYNGNIGIETRGNSTQDFFKKTYSIELWDENLEDQSVNLFGMGGEEDWILHAMVIDKTQLRIPMSFYLWERMGNYAIERKYVELVLNGEYRGLYAFMERLKRDDDRIDIAKLDEDDLAGDSLTGGYILRVDWIFDIEDENEYFLSEYDSQDGDPMTYQYYYPKAENILPPQRAYIKEFMDDFEDAVFSNDYFNSQNVRYSDYVDIETFVDFILINEFSKNADGYKLSSYLHKDRDDNDPRLKAGPIWDFDQTYGLSTVCSSHITSGWTYLQNQEGCGDLESMPLWWQAMMQDTVFTNLMDCRWQQYRESFLHQDTIFAWIDERVSFLENPIERNFERWDFIGEEIWIEPENFPETYDGEIQYLKNWITARLNWLDNNIPGNCEFSTLSTDFNENQIPLVIYPNPSSGIFQFDPLIEANATIRVFNSLGQMVEEIRGLSLTSIDLSSFPKGIYMLNIESQNMVRTEKVIIE
ncbi:MAG: CotH kinase family protein [Bacteroidota bacterium]